MDYSILRYGAVADGVTNCAAAIQQAVDAAAAAGGGRELYCIFAVRREDTLFVYEKQDPQYPNETGKELYGKQGSQPILLLCNGSKEDTDTMVTVYCSTGRSLDWNPQLSDSTGQPVLPEGVYDFSDYPLTGAAS